VAPQLVLCEPDIEDEAEMQFVHTQGAGLFEAGVRVDDSGGRRLFWRVAWIPV
jgi:hypothetical protein